MDCKAQRLAVYYHMPCYVDGDRAVYANPVMGTFVESLAEHFQSVVLLSPEVYTRIATTSYRLDNPGKIRFVSLGSSGHYWDYFQKMRRIKRVVEQTRDQWDILLLRAPTPRAYAIWKYSGKPKHTALLLVGNFFSPVYSNYCSFAGRFFLLRSLWFNFGLKRICRSPHSLIMANSPYLVKHWQAISASSVALVNTSSLSAADIVSGARNDLFQNKPYRLLFVGRVCFDKGIKELLRSLYLLNQSRPDDFFLDIVGPLSDLGSNTLEKLIQDCGAGKFVKYHGTVPFGNELFEFYKKAAVYILPSYHEGMPHSVWEAMSQGTPVIVSRIDGLKDFFEDERDIIFIEPRNPKSIEYAVIKLCDNPELARNLSQRGINKVSKISRENQARKIADLMAVKWMAS